MKKIKTFVLIMAAVVFLLCLYAFLLGLGIIGKNSGGNEPLAFYFLAKGIFCSLTLCLLVFILEIIEKQQ